MSKLDEVEYELYTGTVPKHENGTEMKITPKTREQIKGVFLELVSNTEGINPSNKYFYEGYKLAQQVITEKIEEL